MFLLRLLISHICDSCLRKSFPVSGVMAYDVELASDYMPDVFKIWKR